MHQIKNTYSGTITVIPEEDKVIKFFCRPKLYARERDWLYKLEEFDRVPKIISIKPMEITMEYCGEQVSEENLPKDWREQAKEILDGLKKYGCSHNDIKPSELMVKDGKVYLIDFGWATTIGEEIPDNFPTALGADYRKSTEEINDEYSLMKSLSQFHKVSLPRVLIATSIANVKAYCIEPWLEMLDEFTYPNFDVYLVDNTADNGEYARALRRKFVGKFHFNLEIDWFYEDKPINDVMATCMEIVRKKVLDEEYDYLFSLEQDVFPPTNGIIEKLMVHDKQIINGMYRIGFGEKRFPLLHVVERITMIDGVEDTRVRQLGWNELHEYIDGTLRPIHGCGIGCSLIKKEVLDVFKFRVDNSREKGNFGIHADSFWYMDLWNKGITVWVDTSVMCNHRNSNWKTVFEMRGEQDKWKEIIKKGIAG